MTTITALPEAPNRGTDDPANFSSKADTFVAALQTFQVEANLVATETNAAAGSAVAAAAAATSVTGAAKWAGTTTSYTNGAAVWSPANYKTYRLSIASKAANGANTDPSVDTASWTLVNGTGDVIATATQTLTNKTLNSPILTGATSNAQGSAALPSYTFVGDLNTGAWSPAADTYAVSTGGVERMRIDGAGGLFVGASTGTVPNGGFFMSPNNGGAGVSQLNVGHITGSASGSGYQLFYLAGAQIGSISQSGTTAVIYATTSDQRLKTSITDAPEASAHIDSIKIRSFDWISDGSHQRFGVVAQELFEVAPEAVHAPADPSAMMGVDYSKLVPMLIKEVQSLRARVAALEV